MHITRKIQKIMPGIRTSDPLLRGKNLNAWVITEYLHYWRSFSMTEGIHPEQNYKTLQSIYTFKFTKNMWYRPWYMRKTWQYQPTPPRPWDQSPTSPDQRNPAAAPVHLGRCLATWSPRLTTCWPWTEWRGISRSIATGSLLVSLKYFYTAPAQEVPQSLFKSRTEST